MDSVHRLGLFQGSWKCYPGISRFPFQMEIKSHTIFHTLCCVFFQTTLRGCRNGHPLWGGHAESQCCRHEAGWEEHLFISFSGILYPNIFIMQWENYFLCIQLVISVIKVKREKNIYICVRKVLGSIWLISELTWILMLTSVGYLYLLDHSCIYQRCEFLW